MSVSLLLFCKQVYNVSVLFVASYFPKQTSDILVFSPTSVDDLLMQLIFQKIQSGRSHQNRIPLTFYHQVNKLQINWTGLLLLLSSKFYWIKQKQHFLNFFIVHRQCSLLFLLLLLFFFSVGFPLYTAIIFLSSSGISYVYIFSLHMSSSGDCIDSCEPRSGPPFHPQIYIFDFTPDISTWIAVGHLIFTRFIDDINIYSPNLFILLVFPISVQAPLATFIPRRRRRRKKAATFFKI